MATAIEITQAEILEALASATAGSEDGMTAQELEVGLLLSRRQVLQALKILHARGQLIVHRVRRPSLDGRMMVVPAYEVKRKRK